MLTSPIQLQAMYASAGGSRFCGKRYHGLTMWTCVDVMGWHSVLFDGVEEMFSVGRCAFSHECRGQRSAIESSTFADAADPPSVIRELATHRRFSLLRSCAWFSPNHINFNKKQHLTQKYFLR
jgi:hypothetical protein